CTRPCAWTGSGCRHGNTARHQDHEAWPMPTQAGRAPRAWLAGYANLGDRTRAGQAKAPAWGRDAWPAAFIVAKAQPDGSALQRLLNTLQRGQVEVHESTSPVNVSGMSYPAGSYVVLTQQPFGGFAKALLERQRYPDLREYPNGPPKRPYDVTAHTLPLLFGLDV